MTPFVPWQEGPPSPEMVAAWASDYPDSPGFEQPRSFGPDKRTGEKVVAGRWLVHDPGSVGQMPSYVVLTALDGRVWLRNGFSFWQPLDECRWAARSRYLPCRTDGIPIALLRRLELVDRVLDPAFADPVLPPPETNEEAQARFGDRHALLVARSGVLAEVARTVDDALRSVPEKAGHPEGTKPWDPAIGGKTVLDRLGLVISQRNAAWEELTRRYVADAPGAKPPSHPEPDGCPTWYDGCNCTVEVLAHALERARIAENALTAAGLPLPEVP